MTIFRYIHMMQKAILEIKAEIFDGLGHPLRLKILEKLRAGACCVCRIIPYVDAEQSNVSHHLAILKKAGIVRSEKHGIEVWYEVIDPKIFEIIDLIDACIAGHLQKNNFLLRVLSSSARKSGSHAKA